MRRCRASTQRNRGGISCGKRAAGLGGIALAWLLHRDRPSHAAEPSGKRQNTHFPAKAKRVVQIFCVGGVSHLDTFDYKPELAQQHGKSLTGKGENKGFFGQPGMVMKSPFEFRQHGQSGHVGQQSAAASGGLRGRPDVHPFDGRQEQQPSRPPRFR